jgi:hypothetical protein
VNVGFGYVPDKEADLLNDNLVVNPENKGKKIVVILPHTLELLSVWLNTGRIKVPPDHTCE